MVSKTVSDRAASSDDPARRDEPVPRVSPGQDDHRGRDHRSGWGHDPGRDHRPGRGNWRVGRRIGVPLALLVLAACSSVETPLPLPVPQEPSSPAPAAPTGPAPGPTTPSAPTGGPTAPEAPVDVPDGPIGSWETAFEVDLDVGGEFWTVSWCEGDAPFWCVSDGGRHVGAIELSGHPIDPATDLHDRDSLIDRAEEFLASMGEDRAVGCAAYTFASLGASPAAVGRMQGARSEFVMTDREGDVVERVLLLQAVTGEWLHTVTVAAYADGGCLERLGEFLPEDLAIAEEGLLRLIAATPLPGPQEGPA